jgi:hypothetical protein
MVFMQIAAYFLWEKNLLRQFILLGQISVLPQCKLSPMAWNCSA